MALYIVKNQDKYSILEKGFQNLPCLILDCANIMDPHRIAGSLPLEKFFQVHVIEIEMLYKFRDVLKNINNYLDKTGAKTLVITRVSHLMNYQNEYENKSIYFQCGKMINEISKSVDVYVGNELEEKWAIRLVVNE